MKAKIFLINSVHNKKKTIKGSHQKSYKIRTVFSDDYSGKSRERIFRGIVASREWNKRSKKAKKSQGKNEEGKILLIQESPNAVDSPFLFLSRN